MLLIVWKKSKHQHHLFHYKRNQYVESAEFEYDYILIRLKSRSEKYDISISKSIIKIEFIISSKNDIKIKRFDNSIRKSTYKAIVRLMINLLA